jgi:hypothetical protein
MKMATKDMRIVIVQQGWVYIGEYSFDPANGWVHLDNASCVRVWGTTAGLGQLALKGKQKDTVLDFAGIVDVPLNSIVATIKCDEHAWKNG